LSDQELFFTSILIRGKQSPDSTQNSLSVQADEDSVNASTLNASDTLDLTQSETPISWNTKIGALLPENLFATCSRSS
jgi:hypothetical protein